MILGVYPMTRYGSSALAVATGQMSSVDDCVTSSSIWRDSCFYIVDLRAHNSPRWPPIGQQSSSPIAASQSKACRLPPAAGFFVRKRLAAIDDGPSARAEKMKADQSAQRIRRRIVMVTECSIVTGRIWNDRLKMAAGQTNQCARVISWNGRQNRKQTRARRFQCRMTCCLRSLRTMFKGFRATTTPHVLELNRRSLVSSRPFCRLWPLAA
jgi:hypothetical protein